MKCAKCGGKGYTESFYHYANNCKPLIRQCCDIVAYSRRVQLLLQGPEEAFKALGRKEPFIGKEMNVTSRGLEIKSKPPEERKDGAPCPVIPIRRP